METFTLESRAISRIFDRMGYSSKMVTFRQKAYKKISQAVNNRLTEAHQREYWIFVGSKAEGITSPCENDQDYMVISMDIICSEYPELLRNIDNKIVFLLDIRFTNPGYTFLRLDRINETLPISGIVRDCLVELSPGQLYLSSDILKKYRKACFITDLEQEDLVTCMYSAQQENQGPSCTVSVLNIKDIDIVSALECDCPNYLNAWIARNRSYQWPPVNVLWDVYTSQAHLVPVGFPENSTYFLEWRICFTEGEIKLVHSLNDCLTKVLILLKQIVRATLKPLCKDVTSYIVKNVVFWIAEIHDYNIFTENNLLFVLFLALNFLKTCVKTGNLPSYMIPERNLLANRITDRQRLDLCMTIDCLLRQGPQVVLNSPKMETAITMRYQNTEEFLDFYRRHKEAELFALARDCYLFTNIWTPNLTIEQLLRIVLTDDVVRYLSFRAIRPCFDELEEDGFDLSPDEIVASINKLKHMTSNHFNAITAVLSEYFG